MAALGPGSIVELRAGDSVPADGVVVEGTSTLDLSLLTGESRPVAVAARRPVHAGTVNLSGRLLVEVRSTGEDTRVGRLLRLVEEHAARRAPVVRLADRISAWFVVAVLGLALATLLIWLRLDPAHAVDHAVALLIVSCPCALGLATPLAVAAAVGRAARRGILIKGGDVLEELARTGLMFLDKTGTLTEGRMALVGWHGDPAVEAPGGGGREPLLPPHRQRALRRHRPAINHLGHRRGEPPRPRHDRGRRNGRTVMVGSPAFAAERGVGSRPDAAGRSIDDAARDGLTPVVVCVDSEVVAIAALGDPLRSDARAAVGKIRELGWDLEVLSGDHRATVRAAADQLGVDRYRGEVNPELKAELVRDAAGQGRVVMVGDGVNDAAALAAATVGIGVHGGAEAALTAADVFLARPGLSPVVELLEGSRRTLAVIRRNLIFSLLYNLVAVSLAMAGLMHPLLAAVLMPLSSITVVISSYRAKTF